MKKIISTSLFCLLLLHAVYFFGQDQPIKEQKKTVAFLFGTIHPINKDRTPVMDAKGQRVSLEMVLGTGFFVSVPDQRLGPDGGFFYLVTAKHVLRDADGSFLSSVRIRINTKDADAEGNQTSFIEDIPVTDLNGNLLWLHGDTDADEAVAFPLLPDQKKFDFKAVPLSMFVDDTTLKSDAVSEGDNLYFIGLMAQYYGDKKNYPFVRRGTLALMTDEAVPTQVGAQRLFIAELQSWPGNSGSPVFLNLSGLRGNGFFVGGKLELLGILLGAYKNVISASVMNTKETVQNGTDEEIGISIIVPAANIAVILHNTDAQAQRDAEVARMSILKH